MIWYDFGPIRKSGSIVSTLTLHSLTGTLKGPGPFIVYCSIDKNASTQYTVVYHVVLFSVAMDKSHKKTNKQNLRICITQVFKEAASSAGDPFLLNGS